MNSTRFRRGLKKACKERYVMGWLFAAFLVVWLVFFVYAFSLDRKQKAIADEIAGLSSRMTSK